MASITIRNFPDEVKRKLRIRAAENGRSMEEEARLVLIRDVASPTTAANLGSWVNDVVARFQQLGGVDLELPARENLGAPPDFSGPEFDR